MSIRKKVEVLLVIDYNRRELLGMLLVKHFLRKAGVRAKIVSDLVINTALEKYRPKVMVVPSTQFASAKYAGNCEVVVIPSEHGSGQKILIKNILAGPDISKANLENVALLFSWGEFMTRLLVEEDILPLEKIKTYGAPHIDHWLLAKEGRTGTPPTVGIATTWRVLGKSVNLMDWLDDTQRNGPGESDYFTEPQKSEVWVYWESSLMRLYGELIGDLMGKGHRVQLRPSLPERRSIYRSLEIRYQGTFSLGGKEEISLWLDKVSVLITIMSTTALDAIYAGVPVICIKKLINQDAYSLIPQGYNYDYEEYLWQPADFTELEQMVEKAGSGDLPIAPNIPKLLEVLHDRFGLPRRGLASRDVADVLQQYVSGITETRRGPVYPSGSWRGRISKILAVIPFSLPMITIFWFLVYVFSGRRIGEAACFTYRPWAIKEYWRAQKLKGKLIRMYE